MINVKHIAVVTSALIIGACSNNNPPAVPDVVDPPPPPPPPVSTVIFTEFVKDQFLLTADDTDPVQVEDIDFEFQGLEDPAAYDDLFGP